MSLLNGCFIGTSGIKVLAVKVMSLLIARVTLPDHKKRHNAMMILSKKITYFVSSFWYFLKCMRKMNQNVSFDIYRLGHERVLFMKLKMYPTFLIILCTGMKTNFDGFLKSRRRKNEPYI